LTSQPSTPLPVNQSINQSINHRLCTYHAGGPNKCTEIKR